MLYDYEAIDTRVQVANSRYLYGWDQVKDHMDNVDNLVPIHLINYVYEKWDYAVGSGFEDACNHFMTESIDEPCMTDKPWDITN